MNIKEAKEQIKNAMEAYFSKDKLGDYIIPIEKQRPVFLMGPPGIGKTAIMQQIASEMNVGLLSYSMTHHTRQSVLGLPFIKHKEYQGKEWDISEYTMSEIIASIYGLMEETGVKEGILFLDEINCVSETLAPIMLQFLQYKMLGRHTVPDGWIVVAAGNPPEYNNSVREFDIVTWDRLKRIDIEPDYETWREYEYDRLLHPSILSYLDIKKTDFYKIESTVDGKTFVTARGWDDLGQMIRIYEDRGTKVDLKLVSQYLQNPKIARDFATYYDLFNKYKSDYQVLSILEGKASPEIMTRAKNAKFDERLSFIGLLMDGAGSSVNDAMNTDTLLADLLRVLGIFKKKLARKGPRPSAILEELIKIESDSAASGKKSGSISGDRIYQLKHLVSTLREMNTLIINEEDNEKAFGIIKQDFDKKVKGFKKQTELVKKQLNSMLSFCEEAFGEGQEILIIVTEMTANSNMARFISKYGCEEYFKHNKNLLFYEREKDIYDALNELEDQLF